jgi:hypothetical protein
MCVNADLTRVDLTVIAVSSLAFLALSVYWGRIAWRSSPDEYVRYLQGWRPNSWRKWPVYGWLWRLCDSMPSTTLWQTRIAFVLGIGMGLFGLLAAGTIAFHEQLGIAACAASKPF